MEMPSATVMPFKVWQDNDLELSAKEIRGAEKDSKQSIHNIFHGVLSLCSNMMTMLQ
jgi:hypothetical protein